MPVVRDMERIGVMLTHLGWSRADLAKALGVSTNTLYDWDAGGIPSARLPTVAGVLQVSPDWIAKGIDPPQAYWESVMLSASSGVDWKSVPASACTGAWWDRLEGALLDRLIESDCQLPVPRGVRVARWRFCGDRRGALLDQFEPHQIEALARALNIWPADHGLIEVLRSSLPTPKPRDRRRDVQPASEDLAVWQPFLHELADGVIRWRKASRDPQRRLLLQSKVHQLLTEPQVNEPLVTGTAIVPVLQACVRAARATEILGGMQGYLRTAVEIILREDLAGKPFGISDVGRLLHKRRGVDLINRKIGSGTDRRRQRHVLHRDEISEDVVLGILNAIERDDLAIEAQGRSSRIKLHMRIPLRKQPGGHTWQVRLLPPPVPRPRRT
ncbi:MAG: helix-turn-helix transcriptional regulator [Planctomycetes bacterium]|nr:helix-turn-helix transcriptional regulator [Planctomycetota bacterium]